MSIDQLREGKSCEAEVEVQEWEGVSASQNCHESSRVDHTQAAESLLTVLPRYQRLRSDFLSRHIAWDDFDFEVFYPNLRSETLRCLESRAMEEEQVACNEAAMRSLENMAKSASLDADWRKNKICSAQPSPARTKA